MLIAAAVAFPAPAQEPAPAQQPARAPEDTAAFRMVDEARRWLFSDSTHLLIRPLNALVNNYMHPRLSSAPDRWRWGVVFSPLFGGQQAVGFELGASYSLPRRADPPPQTAELKLSGRWGVTGSRDVTIQFRAPGLYRDWQFLALGRRERMQRTPYFGVFNQAPLEDSLTDAYGNIFYKYSLLRSTLFGSVARRVIGSLWVQGGVQRRYYQTTALEENPTLFGRDVAAGLLPDTGDYRGFEGRLALKFDTRDYWDSPESGVLVELMMAWGNLEDRVTGAHRKYTRQLLAAREFVRLGSRTVLALRQQQVIASDTLPYFLAYEQLTTGLPDDGVIGPRSIRLHGSANQLASAQTFTSFELRHKLINFREDAVIPLRLWLLLFGDYGTLWEPNQDQSTFEFQWALGTGARLQLHKASMVGFDAGITDLGAEIVVLTYFAF